MRLSRAATRHGRWNPDESRLQWHGCTKEQWEQSRCKKDEYAKPALPRSGQPSPIFSYGCCLAGAPVKSKNFRCLHPVAGPNEKILPCGEAFDYPEATNVWNGHFKSKHKATFDAEQKARAVKAFISVPGTSKRGGDGGWFHTSDKRAALAMQIYAVVWFVMPAKQATSLTTAPIPHGPYHAATQVCWYSHLFGDVAQSSIQILHNAP
ncbi:hypothetical protein AB1Y20_007684 [Prymnesium parvum]|uniref:Uncharacterized protein n=1 Tax=Prymnesium parvum TaxID=97485 RepID=A0AB34IVK7_PRYPA|mmetsp:Transcript_35309/g.87863  ORF Transcript_35309/g.87863 Transcript_35309/m.87863 type:complete len:208 (-) Transcript_35309:25-648(-)